MTEDLEMDEIEELPSHSNFAHGGKATAGPLTAPPGVLRPLLMPDAGGDNNTRGRGARRRLSADFMPGDELDGSVNIKPDRSTFTIRGLKNNVADWFGVSNQSEVARQNDINKWKLRSQRTLGTNRLFGTFKAPPPPRSDTMDSVFEPMSAVVAAVGLGSSPAVTRRAVYDPLAKSHRPLASRQVSGVSMASSKRSMRLQPLPWKQDRETVFQMVVGGAKYLITSGVGGIVRGERKTPVPHSRSVTPLQVRLEAVPTPPISACSSVFQSQDSNLDDVFYDTPTPTSYPSRAPPLLHPLDPWRQALHNNIHSHSTDGDSDLIDVPITITDNSPTEIWRIGPHAANRPMKAGWQAGRQPPQPAAPDTPLPRRLAETSEDLDNDIYPFAPMQRISMTSLDGALGLGNKRQIGRGFAGFLTDAEYRKSRIDSTVHQQMLQLDDHRPFFTYWITFVQIVCYIISVSVYGISTIGFSETTVHEQVKMSNMAIEPMSYTEMDNMWIGPRQADLIHLGAKYSPCMRMDENIEKALEKDRSIERETGCCIRSDGGGCVQRSNRTCSTWKGGTGPDGRSSGSVCGQDPRNPTSLPPFEWPDDITKWPVCRSLVEEVRVGGVREGLEHVTCDMTGRPCCTGIQGFCIITTREHCSFLRGYFHQDLTLCSQVSCMNEICGMTPFVDSNVPDQFHRLFISLFIHAGFQILGLKELNSVGVFHIQAFHLLLTILFQVFLMSDLEKLAGSLRIGIIYIWSGVAGSLSSAIFLPYHVEAGPSGSQFGLIACLFVEIIQNWYILTHPGLALAKLSLLQLLLFAVGLFPMIDNYSHLVGFLFGFLLSFAFLPYITFNLFDKRGKLIGIVICLTSSVGLTAGLVVLFYVTPVYECPNCEYFNCLPFTPAFCRTMAVKIERTDRDYF